MNVEALLARLKGVRRSGSGWVGRCPAHEDRRPSLSISERNSKILLHCFAGCTAENVVNVLGLTMRDLFTRPGEVRTPRPWIVRRMEQAITDLRARLTPREREREVVVVLADERNLGTAIARALALAVEGEIVQVALDGKGQ